MTGPRPAAFAPSQTALFRYSVLAQVAALVLAGQPRCRALSDVSLRDHAFPDGGLRRIRLRTLQRWQAAWDASRGDLLSLEPRSRKRTTTSVVLPEALVTFMKKEKIRDPRASVPELLRRAEVKGVIVAASALDRTTAWRACVRMGLPTRYRPSRRELDSRRWRYPHYALQSRPGTSPQLPRGWSASSTTSTFATPFGRRDGPPGWQWTTGSARSSRVGARLQLDRQTMKRDDDCCAGPTGRGHQTRPAHALRRVESSRVRRNPGGAPGAESTRTFRGNELRSSPRRVAAAPCSPPQG